MGAILDPGNTTATDLRNWRTACEGISQRRLAAELGISSRSIQAYENGDRPIPPLYPWALNGAFKTLRSKLLKEARRVRANRLRRYKRKLTRAKRDRLKAKLRADRQLTRDRRDSLRQQLVLIAGALRRGGTPTLALLQRLEELDKPWQTDRPTLTSPTIGGRHGHT